MIPLEQAVGGNVSRETSSKLELLAQLLVAENRLQNIISPKSEADLWRRHIIDSAQLLRLVPAGQSWSDVGSGPGLPGLVLAVIDTGTKVLIEPRRRRAEFLERAIATLGLSNAVVVPGKAAVAHRQTDVITARAVASPARLFELTSHLRNDATTYVLPCGRSAETELAEARNTWQGDFGLHSSLTSDEALILVARNVRRRGSK